MAVLPSLYLASGGDPLETVLFPRRHRLAQAEGIATVRWHLSQAKAAAAASAGV